MATKRRALDRPATARITPEIIRLWRLINEIYDAGEDISEKWEDEGGRHRELLDADGDLCHALGLNPWHYSPADVPSEGERQHWQDPERFELAQRLRRMLDAAAGTEPWIIRSDGGNRR